MGSQRVRLDLAIEQQKPLVSTNIATNVKLVKVLTTFLGNDEGQVRVQERNAQARWGVGRREVLSWEVASNGKGHQKRERETILPAKSLCLRQPLFPTSSRGLFRVKWPGAGVPFSVIKEASRASGSEQHLTQRVMSRRKRKGN